MIRHFIKTAFRQLWQDRFYSSISIAGLAVSMACCLLMLLYLHSEWTYDTHNEKPEQIYRVVFDEYLDLGKFATSPLPVGPALQEEMPEISAMTRVSTGLNTLVRYEDKRFFETLAFVDTGLMEVLTLPLIQGNAAEALQQVNSVIISERYAEKYFGDTNPIGQTLQIGSSGNLNSTVTAVFENFPQNSTVQFDLALPFSTYAKTWGTPDLWQQMPGNYTFIRLHEEAQAKQLRAKLPEFTERHLAEQLPEWREKYRLQLQPLLDIHLHSQYGRESHAGNLSTLYLLGLISLLVLVIAGINYINYATARFSKRLREVSIRKIIGASRASLVGRFLAETLLITTLAGVVAFALAYFLLPVFNQLAGKAFVLADLNQPLYYTAAFIMAVGVGVGAGIFPALFLSGFRPVTSLRGGSGRRSMAGLSRRGLVVAQFTASVVLLVATLTVWRQMNYVRESIRPEVSEQVAVFPINSKLSGQFDPLKQELMGQAGVLEVSAASNVATFNSDSWPVRLDQNSLKVQTQNYAVEEDFIETMGYELITGRDLDRSKASDVESGFVFNEAAIKALGFASPEDALGQRALFGGDNLKNGVIVGVVKDFHFQSFHEEVQPAVIQFPPYEWMTSQFVAVRFQPQAAEGLQATIQETVHRLDPDWAVEVKFLDENFIQIHEQDLQQGRIFGAFALLAILISCLGLLGLATFAAERRVKEIGIRKVLGASVAGIVQMLSTDFLRLVIIAFVLATPLTWYLMNNWLDNFAYRIELPWWIFASAGVATILIALLTVSLQSLRAALVNPANILKTE